jgi:hypothetical protein
MSVPEQEGDAPESADSNESENYPGPDGTAAEYRADEIKIEDSDTAPVQRADYHKSKRYSVKNAQCHQSFR